MLSKLKCVAPGCAASIRHKQSDDRQSDRQSQIEQAMDSILGNRVKSSASEESSALECISIDDESIYMQHSYDDALYVFSASSESDVAQPLRSMESIQEESSTTSQLTRESMSVNSTQSSSTEEAHVGIAKQLSLPDSVSSNEMYISSSTDGFPIQTLSTEATRSIPGSLCMSESQLQLERILEGITAMNHEDDATLESFHSLLNKLPGTPQRSNVHFVENSTLQVQHRISSPLSPNEMKSITRSPPQLNEAYSDLIQRYEKLSQFLEADEALSGAPSKVIDVEEEEAVEEEKEEYAEFTPVTPKLSHDTAVITRQSMQNDFRDLSPAVTGTGHREDMQSPSPSIGKSAVEEDDEEKSGPLPATNSDDREIRKGGTWDDERSGARSSPSMDGSGSFGNASFSSFNVPLLTRAKAKWKQKAPHSNKLTSHPFFWRSHPRVTNTCYDSRPVKLVLSNTRIAPHDGTDVVVNLPSPSRQRATPASSVVALEPKDYDLDAEMDDEDDFLVLSRKPPQSPKKIAPERMQRFDPSYQQRDNIFRKEKLAFPEVPVFSTNFGHELEYTSSAEDQWISSWETGPQEEGEE